MPPHATDDSTTKQNVEIGFRIKGGRPVIICRMQDQPGLWPRPNAHQGAQQRGRDVIGQANQTILLRHGEIPHLFGHEVQPLGIVLHACLPPILGAR